MYFAKQMSDPQGTGKKLQRDIRESGLGFYEPAPSMFNLCKLFYDILWK